MFFDRNPLAGATQFRRELGELFDTMAWPFQNGGRAYPALNVWEEGDTLHAEAELPGMGMEDVEVFVVGNELTIKGMRKHVEEKEKSFHRQERGSSSFSRVVTLPFEVDADKVQATLKDGVLHLCLPKAESARPRKIEVKTS
jgi:HSP20 family protein